MNPSSLPRRLSSAIGSLVNDSEWDTLIIVATPCLRTNRGHKIIHPPPSFSSVEVSDVDLSLNFENV
jgi:hypothetical protein